MTTRIDRMTWALLIAALGFSACAVGRPTQARPLSDRIMTLVLGSNTAQRGSQTYSCSDAAAAANNTYTTTTTCSGLPNAQASGLTCVACQGPASTGYFSDQNGTKLTFPGQQVDCSKSPNNGPDGQPQPSTLLNEGTCQPSAGIATARCQGGPGAGANQMGACPAGNFFVATQQPAQPVPVDSP